MTRPTRLNRLAAESSPYLVQHAGNPVDWFPWGDEALSRSRNEDRPIFLSIGYAACHWCHVMERESFSDPAIAKVINTNFVPIKVDREERPDVDAVYIAAVQAMTGNAGWPLTVFLSPSLEPLFGGTYFPPEPRWGRASLRQVLDGVADAWRHRRNEITTQAADLVESLRRDTSPAGQAPLEIDRARRSCLQHLARTFDPSWGGFGAAPKFPAPARLFFLLRRASAGDEMADLMLTRTLDGMAAGGMYDWLGGGFHRYSVDQSWLVPHFEKMLYDNALLARLYGEAGAVLGRQRWTEVARATADYVVGEMQAEDGGFFASTDADSEGEEGRFYTWTTAEVRAELPAADSEVLVGLCELDEDGNCGDGRSVLRPRKSWDEMAALLATSAVQAKRRTEVARAKLLRARAQRIRPGLDDKRLAGWNAMAIWAMAYLGSLLDEPRYLTSAANGARFLASVMVRDDGSLTRAWRVGRDSGTENLEDVAWSISGMVKAYEADGDPHWLRVALRIADARVARYQGRDGTVYDTPDDGQMLPLRLHDPYDDAAPSKVAVLVDGLVRLASLTGRGDLADRARAAATAEGRLLTNAPFASCSLVDATALACSPTRELVLVGERTDPMMADMIRVARAAPHAPTVIAPSVVTPVPASATAIVPLFFGREVAPAGAVLAYACDAGVCQLPVQDADGLRAVLSRQPAS